MTTFDTNVVVRMIVEDDPVQSRQAIKAWRDALDGGARVFLSKVVLIETSWVLRSAYGFDKTTVAETLRRLLDVEQVEVEAEVEIRNALELYDNGPADFSDYVILESARAAGSLPVKTFDRRLAKANGSELL